MTKKEEARNNRLKRLYSHSAFEVDVLAQAQERKCALCGRPLNAATMNVDHDHKLGDLEVTTRRAGDSWYAVLKFDSGTPDRILSDAPVGKGDTRSEAIAQLRWMLRRFSVRGILCAGRMGCNRKLGRVDNPEWLKAAALYLLHYSVKMPWLKYAKRKGDKVAAA